MNEYKVLGASERNLKAIEMALSNNGSISTNGSVKSDFHYKEEVKGGAEIDLPSGCCLLLSLNGVLSGVPLSVSGGVIVVGIDEMYEPDDPRYYTINYKPIRTC